MRLGLRHPPPEQDAPPARCAHLEALAEAAIGLPLGPAAARVASMRSRGRYGNALQWHFGLAAHDSAAQLDWEDRIEIKLVSVWRRGLADVGTDKVKICDARIDPWHKLANVLWVFVDRLTRVVVATRASHLAGNMRTRLARAWDADPHFGDPPMFIEAHDGKDGRGDPGYYLSARWLVDEGVLPAPGPGVFPFDARWWHSVRKQHGGRDPWPTVATSEDGVQRCRRCGANLVFDPFAVRTDRWAPAQHARTSAACVGHGHFVVAPDGLVFPAVLQPEEALDALEGLGAPVRLFDRVAEPSDHLH